MIWLLKHNKRRYGTVKRRIMSGEDRDNDRPLRYLMEGMKPASRKRNRYVKTNYYSLKNLFGGVKKQNITEKKTVADGTKAKKMIETQIPFDASVNFE